MPTHKPTTSPISSTSASPSSLSPLSDNNTLTLLALPSELHALITTSLPYPDLLALKHTNAYFYRLIRTTKYDRVNWLLTRPALNLPLPQKSKCSWRTDHDFCSNAEVRRFMYRRRKHLECVEFGVGDGKCLVVEGRRCVAFEWTGGGVGGKARVMSGWVGRWWGRQQQGWERWDTRLRLWFADSRVSSSSFSSWMTIVGWVVLGLVVAFTVQCYWMHDVSISSMAEALVLMGP